MRGFRRGSFFGEMGRKEKMFFGVKERKDLLFMFFVMCEKIVVVVGFIFLFFYGCRFRFVVFGCGCVKR